MSHVGMDLIQSLAMSEALTQTLKYTTRRERPDGSGKNSFPSGHAADTFAFATALERHLGMAVCGSGVHLFVVRGHIPIAGQSPLVAAMRCSARRSDHCRPHGHEP